MSQETKTTTRVEAVEVELYECGICEQDYEEDEVFEIGIDLSDAALNDGVEPNHTDYLCKYCSETNFGYSATNKELLTAWVTSWSNDFGIAETVLFTIFAGGTLGITLAIVLAVAIVFAGVVF